MRVSSYLLLVFSFACGIAGSFFIAATFFWKKADAPRPQTLVPVLVAKEDISVGVELTAPLLRFERVAIDEIPTGALARFSDAVHHRTLYPILRDYPVCRDMITSTAQRESAAQVSKFVPVGFRVVSLEVRQSSGNGESLTADQRLNFFVDTNDKPGRLAAMRSEIVGTSPMKCVLEGALVQAVTESVDGEGDPLHTVSLLLTSEQRDSLLAAAGQGRLRVAIASTEEISTEILAEIPETKVAAAFTNIPLPALPPEPVLPEPVLPEPAELLPALEPIVEPVVEPVLELPAPAATRRATFVTPSRASLQHSHTQQGRYLDSYSQQ